MPAIYMNNLANILPGNNVTALFADVSILATNNSKEQAETDVQRSVDLVVRWAKQWKLQLNAGKSEASFFSTSSHEAKWEPNIQMDGSKIRNEKTPRLLGVRLDRNLYFSPHVDQMTNRMAVKQKLIGAVANTEWGWRKEHLTQLYSAFISSISSYADFAWMPCAAKSHLKKLKRAQNKALRLVTGQYVATPVEALRQECGLTSFETDMMRTIARSAEKAERLPADHPRKLAFIDNNRRRLCRDNWRSMAKDLQRQLPMEMKDRVAITHFDLTLKAECKHSVLAYPLRGIATRVWLTLTTSLGWRQNAWK